MKKKEDGNTRYFIDLDLKARKILNWDYGQRAGLLQDPAAPFHQRVFISKGQYNKLESKIKGGISGKKRGTERG